MRFIWIGILLVFCLICEGVEHKKNVLTKTKETSRSIVIKPVAKKINRKDARTKNTAANKGGSYSRQVSKTSKPNSKLKPPSDQFDKIQSIQIIQPNLNRIITQNTEISSFGRAYFRDMAYPNTNKSIVESLGTYKYSDLENVPWQGNKFVLEWIFLIEASKNQYTLSDIITFLNKYRGIGIPRENIILKKGFDIAGSVMSDPNLTLDFYKEYDGENLQNQLFHKRLTIGDIEDRIKDGVIRNGYDFYTLVFAQNSIVDEIEHHLWEGNSVKAEGLLQKNHATLSSTDYNLYMSIMLLEKQDNSYLSYANKLGFNELFKNELFLYTLLQFYLKNDEFDKITKIVSYIPSYSQRSTKWWIVKEGLIMRILRSGSTNIEDYRKAYFLVSNHTGPSDVSDVIRKDWLAGFILLKHLNRPDSARSFFLKAYNNAKYSISKSRAAFWMARCFEKMEEMETIPEKSNSYNDEKTKWLQLAANYSTTFYGQMAIIKMQKLTPLNIFKNDFNPNNHIFDSKLDSNLLQEAISFERIFNAFYDTYQDHISNSSRAELEDFTSDPIFDGIITMHHLGFKSYLSGFITAYIQNSTDSHKTLALLEVMRGNIDEGVFRNSIDEALKNGIVLIEEGYTLAKLKTYSKIKPSLQPLIYSIISRESKFNTKALSTAGAMGLMQVIPSTAQEVAKSLNMSFNKKRLMTDYNYNVTIGASYITRLLKTYDGNYPLAIAAYNAGGGNVNHWLKLNPYPAVTAEDLSSQAIINEKVNLSIDWIEMIPFKETRNYVMRVLENELVYRYILLKTEI